MFQNGNKAARGRGRPKGSTDKIGDKIKKAAPDLKVLLHEFIPQIIEKLRNLAINGSTEQIQLAASQACMDRFYGKPAQSIQHTGKDEGPIKYSQQDARKELLERLEGMAGRQLVELKPAEIRQIEDKNATTH